MANCLISGSAGFIGSHLYKHLEKQGHTVVGIDNLSHPCGQEVPTQYADVRYYKDLLPFFSNCDAVFHLAAQISVDKSIDNPEETIATNILGTQNVLELARKFKTKVIFASSSEVYGTAQTDFINEDHPLDGHSPYAASKIAADRLCFAYWKTYSMPIVIVRNFNTFGEYQNDDSYGGVISKFVKAALANDDLWVNALGTQERDYMHIRDAIKAYEFALGVEKRGEVFNFGIGKTIRIKDLAEFIIKYTNSKSEIRFNVARLGEVEKLCADITKARKWGFEPQTDFWKDLGRYIEWVKERT